MNPQQAAEAIAAYDVEFTDTLLFGGKTCGRCGLERPACQTYWSPDKDEPDGLKPTCRACRRAAAREKYATDDAYREKRAAAYRERYAIDAAYRERRKAAGAESARRRRAAKKAGS